MSVARRDDPSPRLRLLRHGPWRERHPEVVQGITLRDPRYDFRLESSAAGQAEAIAHGGWGELMQATGIGEVVRCRQVHGARVARCETSGANGLNVLGDADALVTDRAGVLLAVTVADCVPVFFIDPPGGRVGLAHAGWRGVAAGVIEATLDELVRIGARLEDLEVHIGPSICGDCYEVGPEVLEALGVRDGETAVPGRVDLKAVVAGRCAARGIGGGRVARSGECTRCDISQFYSYRGGDRDGRMCAFLGRRAR